MSSEDITSVTDFDKLLDLVKVDSNLIGSLSEEQVTILRKKLNPYGKTIEGEGTYTCLSITNLSEQYMKRFLMTGLISFLYRQCDEHLLNEGEPPVSLDDYAVFMTKYNSAIHDMTISNTWLQNNPAPVAADPVASPAADPADPAPARADTKYDADVLYHTNVVERGVGFKKRLVIRQFLDNMFQFNPDKHVRSAYAHNPLDPERETPSNIKKDQLPILTLNENTHHIPPADTFHRWTYYLDSNYEEIRTAVRNIYADKPDLEYAINPYGEFKSQAEADKFIQKHKDEVIADIITLTNSKWNLTGSFKQNRERVNFYNERTVVLEEIFKQMEQDKKLGADLMRKRVKRKKQQNIKEAGPEPEEFKQYRRNHPSQLETMGAEDVMRENKQAENTQITHTNHEECPYDAIQVDVFDMRDGGQTVQKSEFFTETENNKKMV